MLRPHSRAVAHEPSPSDGVAEEVRYGLRRAGQHGFLKDNIAHSNIEDAQPEGREDARLAGVLLNLPIENIHDGTADEVSASQRRLRQMQRRVGFQAVLDIVDDVLRRQDHVYCDIAQRKMQDRRRVREQFFIREVGLEGGGGEDYEGRLPDSALQAAMQLRLEDLLIAEPYREFLRLPWIHIIQADFAELPIPKQ